MARIGALAVAELTAGQVSVLESVVQVDAVVAGDAFLGSAAVNADVGAVAAAGADGEIVFRVGLGLPLLAGYGFVLLDGWGAGHGFLVLGLARFGLSPVGWVGGSSASAYAVRSSASWRAMETYAANWIGVRLRW